MKKTLNIYLSAAIFAAFVMISCQKSSTSQETAAADSAVAPGPNTLTAEEKAAGWELLFDGKGLGEGTANIGGSLITTRSFGNFELSADWKVSPGGNSGIIYHTVEDKKYKYDYETGPEYQVMDDGGWKDPLNDAQKAGSNYDMFPADSTKKLNPVGEWNNARIVYNNGHVEHWLNGQKVVEFEEGSPEYNAALKKSKWMEHKDWNKSKVGAISLQDHGAPVYYRNIKIKVL